MRKFPEPPPCLVLDRKKVHELRESLQCEPEPELADPVVSPQVYRLPGDKLLFVNKRGRGLLYESRQAYLDYLQDCRDYNSRPGHLFDMVMPGRDKTFLTEVPRLVDTLAEKLRIPRDQLDLSIDSMRLVDRRVRRDRRALTPELYPELLAYVGEVIRAETGGRWVSIVADSDGETLEPWILGPDGRGYKPFLVVSRALDEPPYSIREMLLAELAPRFLEAYRPRTSDPS